MGLKAGEDIYCRMVSESLMSTATVVSIDNNNIAVRTNADMLLNISEGKYMILSGEEGEYYSKVIHIDGDIVTLKQVWSEMRGYFRVDDVFAVKSKKVEKEFPCRKSRIFAGYSIGMSQTEFYDETINTDLWKMLVHMNNMLELIMERLYLSNEGFTHAEAKPVNLSASGMRFTMDESVETGDIVEIKMLLPTYPPKGVLTYGNVVRVRDIGNGKCDVALQFLDMDEEVRNEIIKYTLNRQRDIMKKQRQ